MCVFLGCVQTFGSNCMIQTLKKEVSSATVIIVGIKYSLCYLSCSRLQTSWTAMLLHSTRSQREKCSSWTHKALFSWCRSEPHTYLCITNSYPLSTTSLLLDNYSNCIQLSSSSCSFFFFFLCQVPQWHSGSHESCGDGLTEAISESWDTVPEWYDTFSTNRTFAALC